ncbi:MAG: hypothetical protein LBK44_06845 [Spirochaetales bacterium]|nr:hypothetical protein [Spirochaetales bacterium]
MRFLWAFRYNPIAPHGLFALPRDMLCKKKITAKSKKSKKKHFSLPFSTSR